MWAVDYNRNYSSQKDQRHAFRRQVNLACECSFPLFVHEREAHEDLLLVLRVPKLKLWRTLNEVFTSVLKGQFARKSEGRPLRDLLPKLPLERLVVETDAPFMGFQKGKSSSVPADCVEGETMLFRWKRRVRRLPALRLH